MFLVIGPNVWGRGETEAEALKIAVKEYGGRKLPRYLVYDVHPETTLDNQGDICWPHTDDDYENSRPKLIKKVIKGKIVEDHSEELGEYKWVSMHRRTK